MASVCRSIKKKPKPKSKKLIKIHKTYTKPLKDVFALEGGCEGVLTDAESVSEAKRKRNRANKDFVYPIRTPIKHKQFLVFDLESKKEDLQVKGFERPFLGCTFDGEEYKSFRNDARHKGRSYKEEFWHEPGGCIDTMMRHILGLRACEECGIGEEDVAYGSCKECLTARRRYQSKKWIIYAHNFGKFDGLYVLGWFRRHEHLFRCEMINVQSRMLILSVTLTGVAPGRLKDERWAFSDSIALIPLSLKDIGKTFFKDREDVQKIGFDLDLPEDHPDWDAYNDRDCKVLHEALTRFRDLVERTGGTIGMTAASTAMQIYRRRFQTETVKTPGGVTLNKAVVIHRNMHFPGCNGKCQREVCNHEACAVERGACHGCMHDFARKGFFGGRTEIYTTRGYDVFYYDLNSSYPSSMLMDMPVGQARVLEEGASISALERMNKQHIGFVECVVHIPEDCYLPPLPYRYVTAGGSKKLVFPAGTLYGVWNWEELQLLKLVGGKILDVGRSVWYRRKKIFAGFVHTLYSYRKHAKHCPVYKDDGAKCCGPDAGCTYDEGMSYVAKLILNSLFGKWGMNPLREKMLFVDAEMMADPSFDLEAGVLPPPDQIGVAPVRVQHEVEADYICPQISAAITAYSRITYYKGLYTAIQETSKPLPSAISLRNRLRKAGDKILSLAELNLTGKQRDSLGDVSIIYVGKEPRIVDRKTLIYGDTDSCTATVRMKPEGRELGQWKMEEEHIDMEVEQPKFYYYSRHTAKCRRAYCDGGCQADKKGKTNKVRMKGVPREDSEGRSLQTKEVFDHLRGLSKSEEDFGWEEREGEDVPISPMTSRDGGKLREIHFARLTMSKQMLRKGLSSPVMEPIRRSMQSVYDKRKLYQDGTTMPLIIEDPPNVISSRALHKLREAA